MKKALSRTAAIKAAKGATELRDVGTATVLICNRKGAMPKNRMQYQTADLAKHARAQVMIDIALDLMGLTADIQFTGGDWTEFVPKKGA